MNSSRVSDLEWEAGRDGEYEDEQFLGGLIRGIGGALGLGDGESEFEDESPGAQEYEDEQFLGGLLSGIGSALGLGEGEDEYEYEGQYEDEYEGEYETVRDGEDEGEPFLPALLPIAKMALPLIGGLFRKRRRRPARELEYEFEDEGFGDQELELEDEQFLGGLISGLGSALGLGEGEDESVTLDREFEDEAGAPPAMAEVLAAMAAETPSTAEAEALIGAATVMTLTPREQRMLERLIPQLLQATAILTRFLRRRRTTRQVVRVVPTLVRSATRPVARAALRGHPPTSSVVGRVLTRQTRTVLTKPAVTRAALSRNAAAVRRVTRTPAQPVRARGRRRVPTA